MKLIFFDIDGTLVPIGEEILESSKEAIRLAQEKGHKVFIATGRSKSQINKRILPIGFDGYVCATGGYVEYHNKIIFHNPFTREQVKKIVNSLVETNAFFIEQGYWGIYLTRKSVVGITNNIGGKKKKPLTFDEIMERENSWGTINIDDDTDNYYINHKRPDSYCYSECDINRTDLQSKLPDEVQILPPSFMPANDFAGEIMLKKTSKMNGILKISEALNVPISNLYAFGDGDNDLNMLKGCGTGIAMGNATESCKKAADYITDDQHNDGIYNAMKELKII